MDAYGRWFVVKCQAKSKRSGQQCKKDAVPGRNVCHMHGGKSPKGLDHPRFKTGSASRYVPRGNLAELYNEAYDRGAYTELRDEIALTTGMINQVLSQREESAGQIFRQLEEERRGMRRANASGDPQTAAGRLNAILELIARGVTAEAQRAETVKLMDHRRKLVDSEARRLERERQTLTLEQVMMRDAIILAVLKEILDHGQLARIRQRLRECLLS